MVEEEAKGRPGRAESGKRRVQEALAPGVPGEGSRPRVGEKLTAGAEGLRRPQINHTSPITSPHLGRPPGSDIRGGQRDMCLTGDGSGSSLIARCQVPGSLGSSDAPWQQLPRPPRSSGGRDTIPERVGAAREVVPRVGS